MNRKEIEDVVIGLLAETGDTDTATLEAQLASDPKHDLAIDSLRAVELVVGIEEKLGVYVPDDALTPKVCRSLRSIVDLVESELMASEKEGAKKESAARARRMRELRESVQRKREKRKEGEKHENA